MTQTKENPQPLARHNGGNINKSQYHCTLRKLTFQEFISNVCFPLASSVELAILIIEPALIILLLIGGLK